MNKEININFNAIMDYVRDKDLEIAYEKLYHKELENKINKVLKLINEYIDPEWYYVETSFVYDLKKILEEK